MQATRVSDDIAEANEQGEPQAVELDLAAPSTVKDIPIDPVGIFDTRGAMTSVSTLWMS